MESKKKLVEECIKKHDEIWVSEIARKTGLSFATVVKWVKILELEGKIEVGKLNGMKIVKWKNYIRE